MNLIQFAIPCSVCNSVQVAVNQVAGTQLVEQMAAAQWQVLRGWIIDIVRHPRG